MDPNIMIAILSVVLAAATFLIGRFTSAKSTGQEWGELKSDLKHIKDDVTEIKGNLSSSISKLREELAQEKRDRRDSIRRLHDRIDEITGGSHEP